MTDPGTAGGQLTDSEVAADVAERAAALLIDLRSRWDWDTGGAQPSRDLGRRGDRESNDLILSLLATHRPDDRVLSEESADDPARLEAERVWIVDPLDGTREFSMQGRPDWAVHVALWEAGKGITAAAVSQPALGQTYATGRPGSAGDIGVTGAGAAVVLVSDSRPPDFADEVAGRLGMRPMPMGSAGAKAMAVLRGEASAYLHAGGQWEWDSAAPVGVVLGAGLHASRLDGSPLLYNQPRPYLPDLLICYPAVADAFLGALAEVLTG